MNRTHARARGYTIVETLIFLAVTGTLFIMVAAIINGQQRKAEFNQGVKDVESSVQDVSNDIATGYYANTNNFSCVDTGNSGSRPTINKTTSNAQGANAGCTFIGKVIQFAPTDGSLGKDKYKVYTVVGKQKSGGYDAKDFVTAMPTTIYPADSSSAGSFPDASETNDIAGGVTAEWTRIGNTSTKVGAIGFLTSFGNFNATTQLQAGTQDIQLIGIGGSDLTSYDAVAAINDLALAATASNTNPAGGLQVCLQSNGTDQYVIMTIGGGGRTTSVKLEYFSGKCSDEL